MKPVVLCIVSDPSFRSMIEATLQDQAELYIKSDLANGIVLLNTRGEQAALVVVDAFEPRNVFPSAPGSLDFIRKVRPLAPTAVFYGMSAIGGEVLEAMKGEDLCHEAYDTTEIMTAVETLLLKLKG